LLVICPSPDFEAPTRPSTLKVLQAKEHTLIPSSFVVFIFEFAFESYEEFKGVSLMMLDEFFLIGKKILKSTNL
jgi:hypothetical protein